MIRRLGTHFFILLLLLIALGTARPSVVYVSRDATGANTGASWQDAFTTIQAGIDAADSAGGGEVWAKSGIYSGFTKSPTTDSFEIRDPRAVDVIGEERDLYYTSSGLPRGSHLTILYLEGERSVVIPPATFGPTTDQGSFADRLAGLMGGDIDVLVFANHPSMSVGAGDTRIAVEDLRDAANASALDAVEIKDGQDVVKWDYVLAHLDDQSGDCTKIIWGLRADDQHHIAQIDFRTYGVMMGCIPTESQDTVYAERRLALKDMIRRGSFVSLPPNSKCGLPTYTFESSGGSASRMQVRVYMENIGGATSANIRFYGCDYATGNTPGTLLATVPLTLNADNTASYYLTTTGTSSGQPLSVQQKANIKYIRPVITWMSPGSREAYLQPVRIRSNGNWWGGPAHTLAGSQGVIGPSPYPVGGTDTGETIYFDTHNHTTASDGDSSPSAMRTRYWDNLGEIDPTKPRFIAVTDHDFRTPFQIPVASVVEMKPSVQLYGGFVGTETLRDQRDWTLHPTIIDGRREGRCVLADGAYWADKTSAVLDGFTLINGKAASASGGGMLIYDSAPTVRNCTIRDSMAAHGGGVCVSSGCYANIIDCIIRGNQADGFYDGGGGIQVLDSLLNLDNCTLEGNSASFGGAISCSSSQLFMSDCALTGNTSRNGGGGLLVSKCHSQVSRCRFAGNSCAIDGGAVRSTASTNLIEDCQFFLNSAGVGTGKGGGVYCNGFLRLTGCRFTGNTAHDAGGIYHDSTDCGIQNCIFEENQAATVTGRGGAIFCRNQVQGLVAHNTMVENSSGRGGAIFCLDSEVTVANNIMAFNVGGICVEGRAPTLLHNDLHSNTVSYEGIAPGEGDISADPQFADRPADDYHLTNDSECIDAATNSTPGLLARDLDGISRPWGPAVDIGAYEFRSPNAVPKSIADGDPVALEAFVVTASFTGFFYIEADNRNFGLRVSKSDHGIAEGMRADVSGRMRTNTDGERYIEADSVAANGVGTIAPIGMTVRGIGGSEWLSPYGAAVGQAGVMGGAGLNNIGLLIRTWGTVKSMGSDCLYLDDGSASWDSTYAGAVRIMCNPAGFEVGDRLEVTGISSCFAPTEGTIARCVLTRRSEDLRPL